MVAGISPTVVPDVCSHVQLQVRTCLARYDVAVLSCRGQDVAIFPNVSSGSHAEALSQNEWEGPQPELLMSSSNTFT